MPRVKPTKTEQENNHRRAVINDVLSVRGYETSKENLSKLCGFSITTARSRYKDPTTLTIGEIANLKLTDEQIIRIVRGQMPEKQPVVVYINGVKL